MQAIQALINLRKAPEQPGVNDRAGLIEDMNTRYGDEQTLGKVVAKSAEALQLAFGERGSEGIREFFRKEEIIELCNVPLDSPGYDKACTDLAEKEYQHWAALKEANPDAPGPEAGAAFGPNSRYYIQKTLSFVVQAQGAGQSVTSAVANLNAFSGPKPPAAAGQGSTPPPPPSKPEAGRTL
ncbi:hypothetical protein ACFV2V_14530 [Streptomyces sp. NPDC059698]|uniref:hypothetical protein n=1 Tax=unclassified Streptomyces TaxID=2593676 RepID=UPI00116148E3|nr:hypothetical protein [Streptomyces sp. CB02366]WSS57717.1 hypothetical protein OG543_21270 [Streptomyces sp. NBC_01178]